MTFRLPRTRIQAQHEYHIVSLLPSLASFFLQDSIRDHHLSSMDPTRLPSWLSLSVLLSLLCFSSASPPPPPKRQRPQTTLLPQNIQVFFPSTPTPAFINPPPPPPSPPPLPQPALSPIPPPSSKHDSVTKAVVATAASSFAISALLFFLIQRYAFKHHRQHEPSLGLQRSFRGMGRVISNGLFRSKAEGPLKGVVVDENGLDVLYWRKLDEPGSSRCDYCSGLLERADPEERHDQRDRDVPLLPSNSVNTSSRIVLDSRVPSRSSSSSLSALCIEAPSPTRQREPTPLPVPSPPPMVTPPAPLPPPPSRPPGPPPPPPPPMAKNSAAALPAPPRQPLNKLPAAPPPPPPGAGGGASSSRTPPAPMMRLAGRRRSISSRPRLKPLHWDKVPANAEHSMVWDRITDSSFSFDDDLMEALFGYVATNRKSPSGNQAPSKPIGSSSSSAAGTSTQIILLDSRKSQNIAIVLRSLAVSRQDILDALLEGRGLGHDTLEKLSRTAPTKEEESKILEFTGNPSRLADAESFLFHLLRAVPDTFPRVDAMLFRANYGPEVLHVRQSLQTLEQACKEMRARGVFMKLLEAILKAGNRMNAGTARGNAQAFNLTALCKLSDVKSTDGSTTLLHFVVEEVVRSEGKRLVINRNHSMRRTNSTNSSTGSGQPSTPSHNGKEEREREYMKLGLPVVGGLSVEYANVKKSAAIDYDSLVGTCSVLGTRLREIRRFLNARDGGGFVKEMKGFVDKAEGELKTLREEQVRVVELVRRTTEYYQVGASINKRAQQLQLFIIVRDFLVMVDKVCVDLTRNLQKKKPANGEGSARTPESRRIPARFPNLPAHFMSDHSKSSSSDSEDEDK